MPPEKNPYAKVKHFMSIKKITPALAICLMSALWFANINTVSAQTVVLDRVVAIVDSDLVLESELKERRAAILERLRAQYSELPPQDVLDAQILEQLILERVQLQQAKRYEIDPTEEEVNEAIARLAQRGNLTEQALIEDLKTQGLTLDDLRKKIKTELTMNKLQQGVVNSRIRVTEQEVTNFLESTDGKFATSPDFHLGHILIAVSSSADPAMVSAAEKEATEIYERLQKGGDFEQLAISHSNDQSALQGGDIGWRKLAQLPELFAKQLDSIKTGAVTKPFRSGAGFHLLKKIEQRGGGEQLVEQTLARHILVKTSEILDDEQAQKKLRELRARLLKGEDFAKLARENSEDPGSMLSGGDLGWSVPGMFVPEFEETMKNSAIGEISEPFKSPFGWHILQVQERRKEDMSEQMERNQASNIIRSRRFDEELQSWLTQIREEAYVEVKI